MNYQNQNSAGITPAERAARMLNDMQERIDRLEHADGDSVEIESLRCLLRNQWTGMIKALEACGLTPSRRPDGSWKVSDVSMAPRAGREI